MARKKIPGLPDFGDFEQKLGDSVVGRKLRENERLKAMGRGVRDVLNTAPLAGIIDKFTSAPPIKFIEDQLGGVIDKITTPVKQNQEASRSRIKLYAQKKFEALNTRDALTGASNIFKSKQGS